MTIQSLGSKTWPRAIIEAKQPIMSNKMANALLLESEVWKERKGNYAFIVGKMEVHEAQGRPFGKRVVIEDNYNGWQKHFIYNVDSKYQGMKNIMLLLDHTIRNETSSIQLFNAQGKQIASHDEIMETHEVFVKLNGNIFEFELKDRNGGNFAIDGSFDTQVWASDTARIGLLVRSDDGEQGSLTRRVVDADSPPYARFEVLVDTDKIQK